MIYDVDQRRKAADLTARLPGWVVVWGAYHRRYSAFGACTPSSTIIDSSDPDQLIDRMRDAQLALLHRGQQRSDRPPAPLADTKVDLG